MSAYTGKWSRTVRCRVNRAQRAHRDLDGHDLALDHQWEAVDPSGFYPDPSLEEWPRPRRTVRRPASVRREDFDPAGLPPLGGAA